MDLMLEKFEGPLDLLLHLIKTNKIDIYDIPISELTEQYIDYLRKMEELNMDIASEFIVMASELLYIKSKMLLPKEKPEEEEEDPRQELVEKLLDYQRYLEMSSYLKEREQIGLYSFTKNREKIKGLIKHSKIEMEKDSLIETLDNLYIKMAERVAPSKEAFSGIVEREIVSVSLMAEKLKERIFLKKESELTEVFMDVCKTRPQLAATFMALLDMIKENVITIEFKNGAFFLKKGEN